MDWYLSANKVLREYGISWGFVSGGFTDMWFMIDNDIYVLSCSGVISMEVLTEIDGKYVDFCSNLHDFREFVLSRLAILGNS